MLTLKMASTLKKTFSAACKAHAVLEWTIEDARSIQQRKQDLYSDGLPFSDFGFGASSLSWRLDVVPDFNYEEKRNGDPKFIGVFLCLTADEDSGPKAEVQASFTLQMLEHTFVACSDEDAFGVQKAFSHASVFGENPSYMSADGTLKLRATVDFEFANDPVAFHAAASSGRLADLYSSKELGDFELVSCDGRKFPVHRAILAAHSSVFQGMFKYGTQEKKTRRTTIVDVDGETLDILLQFIYPGKIAKVREAAEKVLQAAGKYNVSDLRNLAVKYLCESLTVENAYRMSVVADQRNLPVLREAVSEFIVKNWDALRETQEYLRLKMTSGPLVAVVEAACSSKKRSVDSV